MQDAIPSFDQTAARPVILGTGLIGLAISRSLAAAGINHVLVGDRPTETPRLGESLNAEGSLEIARQFPDLSQFFFAKRRQVLFFGGHVLAVDLLEYPMARSWYSLAGYPPSIQSLHVDRIGFDAALFKTAIADPHCDYLEQRAVGLIYDAARDRIDEVQLARGQTIDSSYVFDATNHMRFVARKIGLRRTRLGTAQRVVFRHYKADPAQLQSDLPWLDTTSLLRLNAQTDQVEGLAWCIPIGNSVSVGTSVDPAAGTTNSALLLDWVEKAYAKRGIDIASSFPERGDTVALTYEHYNHERCYGSNWLLAGPACCQFWFPAAAGVATGLLAARLAPAVLQPWDDAAALYQTYVTMTAATHAGLEWMVSDDPWTTTSDELQNRSQAMIAANAQRFGYYLDPDGRPPELAYGDSLLAMYENDRRLASLTAVDTASPEAQGTWLFARDELQPPAASTPLLTKPDKLDGPFAIEGVVGILAGQHDLQTSAALLSPDFNLNIDQFQLHGLEEWNAWVAVLRASQRVTDLRLVPGSVAASGANWVLTAQWQGVAGSAKSASPPFTMTFVMEHDRVSALETQRADYAFVLGDSILPQVAFAEVVGQLTTAGH
jgi:flavin-dependent dehydrogenase